MDQIRQGLRRPPTSGAFFFFEDADGIEEDVLVEEEESDQDIAPTNFSKFASSATCNL